MQENFLSEIQQLEIGDLEGNLFKVKEGFPEQKQYQKYRVANTTPFHIVINEANIIIFQIIDIGVGVGFSVISDYCFSNKIELICNIKSKILELFTTLSGTIYFHLQNDKIRAANEGCFNLMAAPFVSNRATVPRGHIRTFDAHLERSYLEEKSVIYPVLKPILNADAKGGTASIHEDHEHFTLKAAILAYQLIRTVDQNVLYIDLIKPIFEKWIDALLNPQGSTMIGSKYTNSQIESLSYIISYIMEYTDRHLTVSDLINESKQVYSLTEKQIREALKIITGKTPIKFIKECKMLEARRLVDKGYPEKEVAVNVGYDYITHLERDFKIYFGISIKEYKSQTKQPKP